MMERSTTPARRYMAAVAAAVLVTMGLWGIAAPAHADAPPEPAAEFVAPLCVGETLDDPTNAAGAVPNLASVFGARLDDYNMGRVVALYDVWGDNELNGYPPVCGTRYVEGVGPVSEWMFCTDYRSHVCSGVDAEGNLLDIDGNVIPGMGTLPGANPKLTADQEKLIAYLIQHGRDTYDGVGYFDFNATARAVVDGGSFERAALQVLVWCISDPIGPAPTGAEIDRAATCENSMSAATQASILAELPDDPTLAVAGPVGALEVGTIAEFTVTTDVFTSPLSVTTSGAAGTLTVVSGPGVLTGTDLQVTGTTGPQTVVLGFAASTPGSVDLAVSATPAATSHIGWNQSPGVSEDGISCQVFATFHVSDQVVLTGAAAASFVADGGTDGGTDGGGTDGGTGGGTDGGTVTGSDTSAGAKSGQLAATGTEPVAPFVLIAAFGAVIAGALLVSRARRTPSRVVVRDE